MMEFMDEAVIDNRDLLSLLSSNNNKIKKSRNITNSNIAMIGDLLLQADIFLEELDSNQLLGSAILRKCNELANVLGNFAKRIEEKNIIQNTAAVTTTSTTLSQVLRDIEESFRSISTNEAEEIADVAVTVARMFVLSMQKFNKTIHHQSQDQQQQSKILKEDSRIELLEENYSSKPPSKLSPSTTTTVISKLSTPPKKRKRKTMDRIRPLWPPLGPSIAKVADRIKQEATETPLLAGALFMLFWPMVLFTALLFSPIFVADYVLQGAYGALEETAFVVATERTTAQIVHASRLSWLCGGLAWRQTARVASRQIDRNGGWVCLSQTLCAAALCRVAHPVETLSATWNGLCAGGQWIQRSILFVKDVWDREKDRALAEKMDD